jgi:hypothetical protein
MANIKGQIKSTDYVNRKSLAAIESHGWSEVDAISKEITTKV